jgi:hypothetical protein
MSSHLPPVPPANRSDKGPGSAAPEQTDTQDKHGRGHENLREEGQAGNMHQNLTHKDHHKDTPQR